MCLKSWSQTIIRSGAHEKVELAATLVMHVIDNKHLLNTRENRKCYDDAKDIILGTKYEHLVVNRKTPDEKQRLANALKSWDKQWNENFKDKYGSGE